MRIHLPNSGFLGNIDPVLRGFDPSDPGELTITANERWISVHPLIVTMITALGRQVKPQNIHWENATARSTHYFERIGFFKQTGAKAPMLIEEHDSTGRFIPVTRVMTSQEQSDFINDIVPMLHLDYEQAAPIKYVIGELLRNVIEHASSKEGAWACAQRYAKSNTVRIGIVDTGIGIKKSLSDKYPVTSDLDAIRYALMPGVSGSEDMDLNAGAGLYFTKTIAQSNKNFFLIYSGSAAYKLLKTLKGTKKPRNNNDPFKDRHSNQEGLPYWQGTAVGIDITLDNTKSFTEMMQEMRTQYTKRLRENRRIIKMRPRFI